MVQIGTIEYEAKVTGVEDAQEQTRELQQQQEGLAQASEESAGSMDNFAGTVEQTGDETEQTSRNVGILDTSTRLLRSTIVGTIGAIGGMILKVAGLGAVAGTVAGALGTLKAAVSGLTLSGIIGSVVGGLKGFAAWLAAGSAGALAFAGAIGAGLGLLGAWVLEVTGALDAIKGFGTWVRDKLPGWVRDGILQVISIVAGPLALAGGMIKGFFEDGWSGAVEAGKRIIRSFVGAWKRQLGRIKDALSGAVNWITTTWNRGVTRVKRIWGRGVSRIKNTWDRGVQRVGEIWNRGVDRVMNIWNRGVDRVTGAWNSGVDSIQQTWDRGVQRVKGGWQDLENTFSRGWQSFKQDAKGAVSGTVQTWNQGVNRMKSKYKNLKNSVIGFFGDMKSEAVKFGSNVEQAVVNTVRSGFNSVVPDRISLPSTTIDVPEVAGGRSFTIGGQSLDLPQLQVGGMVNETGIAQVHEGEAVIPEPIVQSAETSTGGGDAGGGSGRSTVVIENLSLNLSGEFNPSDMSRRELEDLADNVASAIGEKTQLQAGTR